MKGKQGSSNGLPSALLAKWATPFDTCAKELRKFLPIGDYPDHLTEDKCLKMHALHRDAINETEHIEEIIASRIKSLKRKRTKSSVNTSTTTATATSLSDAVAATHKSASNSVGWIQPTAAVLSRSTPPAKEKPQLKKKERSGDGQQIKRRKGSSGKEKKPPPHQPAWATRAPKAGDQVAAKVDDEALWILATVKKHNEKKGHFVVVDEDADEGKRREFKLRRGNILTLARPSEASGAIFPVGSKVMTLYPHTTTFYPATISRPFIEGRHGAPDHCVMHFQDDDLNHDGVLPHRTSEARYVRLRA